MIVDEGQGSHADELTDGDDETGRIIRARRAPAEDELATLGGDGFGERPTAVGSRELEPARHARE